MKVKYCLQSVLSGIGEYSLEPVWSFNQYFTTHPTFNCTSSTGRDYRTGSVLAEQRIFPHFTLEMIPLDLIPFRAS